MIRGGETSAAHRADHDRAVAARAIAVAPSGDQDEATASAPGLNASEPGPVPGFICGPGAEVMFAALGRRGLLQDRAGITHVQISALAVRDSASRVVVVPGWQLRQQPPGLDTAGH
jgi:hypothetical protein